MKQSNPTAEKRFFSVREAAVYSGLSPSLLYQKLSEKVLRFYTVNSKIIIDREDLLELILRGKKIQKRKKGRS